MGAWNLWERRQLLAESQVRRNVFAADVPLSEDLECLFAKGRYEISSGAARRSSN